MTPLRSNYKQGIPHSTKMITSLIDGSKDFVKEEPLSYGEQLYTSSIINKIVYRILTDNKIQLSENAGLGGPFELIGEMNIRKINDSKSEISIKFQIGVFPIITPYIFIVIFGLSGIFMLFIESIFSLFPFGLMLISLILMFAKQDRVGFFLRKIEQTLNIENHWIS